MSSVRTTSSSGITATGLKKWNPTTRSGCSSRPAIAVTESDEVLVASTVSGPTTFSRSAKTCAFSSGSSNTASMTKSVPAKSARSSVPRSRPRSRLALSRLSLPLRTRVSISAPMAASPRSRRSWSTSVTRTGTSSRRANSSASWPAINPAPTTPTALTSRASVRSGAAVGLFSPARTSPKAYKPAWNWSPTISSVPTSSSAAKAASRSRERARSIRSSARAGATAALRVRAATMARPRLIAASHAAPVSTSVRSGTRAPDTTSAAQRSDRSRKSAGENMASASPRAKACLPRSIRFWLSAFSIDDRDGGVRTHEVGEQVGAAPGGHQPEEALGQTQRRHARGDRAVRAVQRQLEPAAQRGAVEEGERRPFALA